MVLFGGMVRIPAHAARRMAPKLRWDARACAPCTGMFDLHRIYVDHPEPHGTAPHRAFGRTAAAPTLHRSQWPTASLRVGADRCAHSAGRFGHGTHVRFQLVCACQVFHGLNMYWFTLIIKKILRRSRGQAYSHSDKAE